MTEDQMLEACVSSAVSDRFRDSVVWREALTDEDREDACQDARLAAWKGLSSYVEGRGGGSKMTRGIFYAKRALMDAERSVVASRRRRRSSELAYAKPEILDEPGALDRAASSDLALLVSGASRFLPPDMARAVNLRFGLDSREPMTHSQVAEEMGVSETKAWKLVREGIVRLRAEMRVDEILESSDENE